MDIDTVHIERMTHETITHFATCKIQTLRYCVIVSCVKDALRTTFALDAGSLDIPPANATPSPILQKSPK